MAGRMLCWLVVVVAVSVRCDRRFGSGVSTWPACSDTNKGQVVKRGEANSETTTLHLANCHISSLNLNDLLYTNLKTLSLNNNNIPFIEGGTFDNLISLNYLNLNGNRFLGKDLPSSLLRKCSSLFSIDFSDNNMSDTPADLLHGLSNLKTLSCNNCSLLKMPAFLISSILTLAYLDLNHNELTRLDDPYTFVNLFNIGRLELSFNKIDYLHEDLLMPLAELWSIDMASNKIRRVPEKLFQNRSRLYEINLADNIIDYIPEKAFLGTSLTILKLTNNRLFYLPENFLSVVLGSGGRTISFYFDGNPWPCACLNKMLIQLKELNIHYENKKYDGKHKICLMIDDFKCLRSDIYFHFFRKLIRRISANELKATLVG